MSSRRILAALLATSVGAILSPAGCSCGSDTTIPLRDGSLDGPFCELPGSLVYAADGEYLVAGAKNSPDLSWLTVPTGFCVHHYGTVPNARQIKIAPGGELFVASPTSATTGGGPDGRSAIVVLPDDDADGFADGEHQFLGGLPSTQGLLFAKGSLYYQDHTKIRRLAYAPGDRKGKGPGEVVVDVTVYVSELHWPKALDMADDGTLYVSNGGDQAEDCDPSHPFHGGILAIDGSPGGKKIAKGCRNPIAIRCVEGKNRCYAAELSKDYSGGDGGREKLIPIRAGDDWGFPCCAGKDLPYADVDPVPECSGVVGEAGAFTIGDTPFAIEFDLGRWPGTWERRAIVALHGEFGTWTGARVVAIATDPKSGKILPADDLSGESTGAMKDFATGWDDGTRSHGRPSALAMAPDGRLFVANDTTGEIVWIAPIGLTGSRESDGGAEGGDGGT